VVDKQPRRKNMGCYFNSDVPFYYEEDKNGKLFRMPKLRHPENKKVAEKIINKVLEKK